MKLFIQAMAQFGFTKHSQQSSSSGWTLSLGHLEDYLVFGCCFSPAEARCLVLQFPWITPVPGVLQGFLAHSHSLGPAPTLTFWG